MIGIGAMIHYLSGGSQQAADKFYGRKITAAKLANNRLQIEFSDGAHIAIWDDAQSCCENRYMSCDDDVTSLVGHKLVRIEAKEGVSQEDDWSEHETCFVEVGTDDGFITLANHNEHNGYYGGFGLTITLEETGESDQPEAPTF